jgi:uncharacterized protein YigE (DUF2233 family)
MAWGVSLWAATAKGADCERLRRAGVGYVVCTFDARHHDVGLFHRDLDGRLLDDFPALVTSLEDDGRTVLFAMNAGMYRPDRGAVGLLVTAGAELEPLNMQEGAGNFFLKPNGVFWIDANGAPAITETNRFAALALEPREATQSGPLLVVDGALHPALREGSRSRFIRNGVGVDGDRVVFAISDRPVTLHAFAGLFRDTLKTPNALYLDGAVSRLYAPELGRNDTGVPMGPVIAVTHAALQKKPAESPAP